MLAAYAYGMDATDRLIEAWEYAALPDDGHRHSLVGGCVVAEPVPSHRHDRVRRRLERLIEDFLAEHELGECFGEAGYLLAERPDTVRGPDISFISQSRLEGFNDAKFFRGSPDLAIEILSPSNRAGEIHGKIADYLAAGARLCWVVDPERRRVSVYSKLLFPIHLAWDDVLEGADVLPGFSVRVAALFD